MKKLLLLLVLTCANNVAIATSVTSGSNINVELGQRLQINSESLNETREFLLHLPKTYADSQKSYPVLYLLDGERHLQHAILASQLLQSELKIPELIIVAVPNKSGARSRDLATEKDTFIQFLQAELIPHINKSYRTSGLNTLYGHSLAGRFTLDLLAQHPDIFDKYIAANPPLRRYEERIYQQYLLRGKQETSGNKSIYFSLASQMEEGKAATDAMESFLARLTQAPPAKLDWHYDQLLNETHISAYYPSLFNGLNHVFKDYQAPLLQSVKEYQKLGGLAGIKQHYQQRAINYGIGHNLPEVHLTRIGNFLLQEGQSQEALALYLSQIEGHASSAQVYSGLGEVYKELKDYDQAIEAHQTAIKLAANMQVGWQGVFKRRLQRVQQEKANQ